MRNSTKRKTRKVDQSIYNLTELGYDLRIIFMKSLYIDTDFIDSLLSNILNSVGDIIMDSEYDNNYIFLKMKDDNNYELIIDIIEKEYINTLYQYKNIVEDILKDNNINISISKFPVMTNITRYGNSLNIAL